MQVNKLSVDKSNSNSPARSNTSSSNAKKNKYIGLQNNTNNYGLGKIKILSKSPLRT